MKLTCFLLVGLLGLALLPVQAAAVLADRQLVGFPKTTANLDIRDWRRLTVVGDQVFVNPTEGGGSRARVSALDLRTLSLTNPLPLTAVYAEVAAREELAALRHTGFYFSFVGEKLVALVGLDGDTSPPFPQLLLLVDRHQWPKVLAVYPLGRIDDPRFDEGPNYLSGAAFLGDRFFLGVPRWFAPVINQLEEPLVSSGLGEFSVAGPPPRNFPSTRFSSTTTVDLRFIGETLIAFHGGDRFNHDWLTAWNERNGVWEVVWKQSRPEWSDLIQNANPPYQWVGKQGEGFWVTGISLSYLGDSEPRPPLSWVSLADGAMRPWTNQPGHEIPFGTYSGTLFRDSVILANDPRGVDFALTQVGTNAVPGIVALDPESRTVLPWRPVDSLVGQNGLSLLGTDRYLLIATGTDIRAYAERGAVWLDAVGRTGSELRLRLTGTQGDRVVVESSGDLRQWEELSVRELRTEADLDVVIAATAESRWFRARVLASP
jgi:hypothetical protein